MRNNELLFKMNGKKSERVGAGAALYGDRFCFAGACVFAFEG